MLRGLEKQTWASWANISVRLQPGSPCLLSKCWEDPPPFIRGSLWTQSLCGKHIDSEEDNGAETHDPHCINPLCMAQLLPLCLSCSESRPAGSRPSPSVLFTGGQSELVPDRASRHIDNAAGLINSRAMTERVGKQQRDRRV